MASGWSCVSKACRKCSTGSKWCPARRSALPRRGRNNHRCFKEGFAWQGRTTTTLVNEAVMLPKFSHIHPPELTIGSRLTLRVCNEMSQVRFDIILHSGSCRLELVEALEFISKKLIVGRVLQREEIPQKGNNFCGPGSHVISAADSWLKPRLIFKPSCSKLLESGSTDLQVGAGRGDIPGSGVKISQGFNNKTNSVG